MSKTDSMNSKLGDLKIRQVILDMDAYLPPLESRDPEKHLLMDFNESLRFPLKKKSFKPFRISSADVPMSIPHTMVS